MPSFERCPYATGTSTNAPVAMSTTRVASAIGHRSRPVGIARAVGRPAGQPDLPPVRPRGRPGSSSTCPVSSGIEQQGGAGRARSDEQQLPPVRWAPGELESEVRRDRRSSTVPSVASTRLIRPVRSSWFGATTRPVTATASPSGAHSKPSSSGLDDPVERRDRDCHRRRRRSRPATDRAPRRNAIRLPSGDHRGCAVLVESRWRSGVERPSRDRRCRCRPPPRTRRGRCSQARTARARLGRLPAISATPATIASARRASKAIGRHGTGLRAARAGAWSRSSGATFRGGSIDAAVARGSPAARCHRCSGAAPAPRSRGTSRVRSRSRRSVAVMRRALPREARPCSGSGSVPSAARSAARARERRDWAVPSGMPSVVATHRDGHPDVVVQDEDGPLLGPKGDGSRAPAGRGRRPARSRRRRVGVSIGVELDLDGPSLAPAGDVEAGVDGQAMEPGVEVVRVAQPRQALQARM